MPRSNLNPEPRTDPTRFLLTRTYEIVTTESANFGEPAESGFDFEDSDMDFRDLLSEMKNHPVLSRYPIRSADDCIGLWSSSYPSTDYTDGSETTYSIHIRVTNSVGMTRSATPLELFRLYRAAGLIDPVLA